jgi:hypothetical protein
MKVVCSAGGIVSEYDVSSFEEAVCLFGFEHRLGGVVRIRVDPGDPLRVQVFRWRAYATPIDTEYVCSLENNVGMVKVKGSTAEEAIRKYIHQGGPCEISVHMPMYVDDGECISRVFVSNQRDSFHVEILGGEEE